MCTTIYQTLSCAGKSPSVLYINILGSLRLFVLKIYKDLNDFVMVCELFIIMDSKYFYLMISHRLFFLKYYLNIKKNVNQCHHNTSQWPSQKYNNNWSEYYAHSFNHQLQYPRGPVLYQKKKYVSGIRLYFRIKMIIKSFKYLMTLMGVPNKDL